MTHRIRALLLVATLAPATAGAQVPAAAGDTASASEAATPDTLPARLLADAYVDEQARELVRLARVRRTLVDRRIEAYSTTARERFSVALRAGIVEKLLYRRETATRIEWERDGPLRMEVLGMREVAPVVEPEPAVPSDMSAELLRLAFDPFEPSMLMRVDSTEIRHPLASGSEANYRFETGDTTVIRLPTGRTVRLRELRIIPRRTEPRLISGSFWLDAETHAVVQAYFRLARGADAQLDVDGAWAAEQAVGLLRPMRANLDFVAIEYGLWEMRWWLPRLVAARGYVQVSRFRVPMSYERTYEGYTVRGDTSAVLLVGSESLPKRCRPRVRYAVSAEDPTRHQERQARTDSARVRRQRAREKARTERGDSTAVSECEREVIITAASDSALAHSPELPPDLYADHIELVSEDELHGILERVRSVAGAPWRLRPPRIDLALQGPGLVRYNRVEGLSAGARGTVDLGAGALRAEARIGTADLEPRGELALERRGDALHSGLAAYRRLRRSEPAGEEPGLLASAGALLLGRDDADYFDAVGGELVLRPPESLPQWYDVRFYAERQRAVERGTDFSLVGLVDSDREFRENFAADAADQIGARLRVRGARGRDPRAPRVAGELSLGGETGDFRFIRPEAVVRASSPLPLGLAAGVEAAAGTLEGEALPSQALWRLGGASTLRGYPSSSLVGERYWRGRAELGRGVQAARLTVFWDGAWAGSRHRFVSDGALNAAGVGLSLLDGVVRLDLARALDEPRGWRLHLHFNGVL